MGNRLGTLRFTIRSRKALLLTFATLHGAASLAAEETLCKTHGLEGSYGWEDGEGTVFDVRGTGEAEAINIDADSGPVHSGSRALKLVQKDPTGVPQAWIAFIENLQDGDEITARAFVYDTTPGSGVAGYPSYRIWAHYASTGNPNSQAGSASGNHAFSSGVGWEAIEHTWIFDSDGGERDALMIEIRLYANEPAEFFVDDVSVAVCSSNPDVRISFPDAYEPPHELEPCKPPALGEPVLSGFYSWEDKEGTVLGLHLPAGGNNVDALNVDVVRGGEAFEGTRSLQLTESPHLGGTPRAYLALIEGLEHGDVVDAGFFVHDDVPGAAPRLRIWGAYARSADLPTTLGSAGGNHAYSAGVGWEEMCHTWLFDAGHHVPPRDALLIEVRLYSTPSICESCSTDYFVDALRVDVWSSNPAVTISFPDGTTIGDPAIDCLADIDGDHVVGFFDQQIVRGAWGTADPWADVNDDGIVDGADLGIVLGSYGPCSEFLMPTSGEVGLVVTAREASIGYTAFDIAFQLDHDDDQLVSVFDANLESTTGFENDSFVTIGHHPPNQFLVMDPNFNEEAFNLGNGPGENAGWFDSNPPLRTGRAGDFPSRQVMVGTFVVANDAAFAGELNLAYRSSEGRAVLASASFDASGAACPADLDGDGFVDVFDLLVLLSDWGPCQDGCVADLTGTGQVDVLDLLALLSAWGPCP